jgi:hypothetical protein
MGCAFAVHDWKRRRKIGRTLSDLFPLYLKLARMLNRGLHLALIQKARQCGSWLVAGESRTERLIESLQLVLG